MPSYNTKPADFFFPAIEDADDEGLLVIGGCVHPERIIEAYSKGIFPWYDTEHQPLWWSPDPRFVLFPAELNCSRSMTKLLASNRFQFTINTAFEQVINGCASSGNRSQIGTWLTGEMIAAYTQLFYSGYAYSGETWLNGKLAGGIYGVKLGKLFCAESMFHTETNASKFALIKFVRHLQATGVEVIDCQVYSRHVATLGARLITRAAYKKLLDTLLV